MSMYRSLALAPGVALVGLAICSGLGLFTLPLMGMMAAGLGTSATKDLYITIFHEDF